MLESAAPEPAAPELAALELAALELGSSGSGKDRCSRPPGVVQTSVPGGWAGFVLKRTVKSVWCFSRWWPGQRCSALLIPCYWYHWGMSENAARAGRLGREYLRVSYDRSGRERSQDEQHDDNARTAAEHGILLGVPYREAGSASASRYATKSRDDFARLLADLEAGRFGADVLVLWESSRGSRKVGDWVTLIEVCEQQSVSIFVTTHGREYQPANGRDRRSLLEDAVDSEYESSKVSARIKRAAAANARAGKPHGSPPFGYVRRYDEVTRKFLAQEPHPVEAAIVRELFARLKAGHSFYAIARDFQARGIVNHSGRPFTTAHLRTLALNPAYAGVRVHQPKDEHGHHGARTVRGQLLDSSVMQTDAVWEGLVSKADFLAVQAILHDPKRVTTKPGKGRHLLSMIARCDACGGRLAATARRGHEEYQCHEGGHIRVRKDDLDAYATTAMLTYLARADVYEQLTADEGQAGTELAALRDDLAQARHELQTLRARVGAGQLSVDSLVAAEPLMITRIAGLEEQEKELATPSALRGLLAPGPDVAQRWEQAPMSTRRAVARLLLTPDLIGELRVQRRAPHQRGRVSVPVDERVVWRRPEPA